jgi:hypothetical protein
MRGEVGGDGLQARGGERLERFAGQIAGDDRRAALVQQLRDGAADAARRTRDRGPGAGEVQRVGDRLLLSDPIPA